MKSFGVYCNCAPQTLQMCWLKHAQTNNFYKKIYVRGSTYEYVFMERISRARISLYVPRMYSLSPVTRMFCIYDYFSLQSRRLQVCQISCLIYAKNRGIIMRSTKRIYRNMNLTSLPKVNLTFSSEISRV